MKLRVNDTEMDLKYSVFYTNVENNHGLKPINFMEVELIVEKGDTETYCNLERQLLKDNYVFLQTPQDSKVKIKGMYHISPREMSKFAEHNILEEECRVRLTAQIDLVDKREKLKSILLKVLPISALALTFLVFVFALCC